MILQLPHILVLASKGKQLFMTAFLNDNTIVKDYDLVAAFNSAQSMGYDEDGWLGTQIIARLADIVDCFLHLSLSLVVQGTCSLVKADDLGLL